MRIFILDKEGEDVKILKSIIVDNYLGFLVGVSNDSLEGIEEINNLCPDLVILDMLKEEIDGFKVIEEIRKKNNNIKIILLSCYVTREDIEKAYIYGVEYFIYKPINTIEVKIIMEKIKYKIGLEQKLEKARYILNDIVPEFKKIVENRDCEEEIKNILLKLGIMGEIGSEDIVKVASHLIKANIRIGDISIREICSKFSHNPRAMEQRMRRTINVAMSNIASLGIEDYMNETFVEYSNTLFNFEQIKREMDYIRNKSKEKGSINMKKFLVGISILCEKTDD